MTLGKPWFCTFTVEVSWETALSQYSSFSDMMALKRLCVSDAGEHSALHIDCSGPGETELQAILLGV